MVPGESVLSSKNIVLEKCVLVSEEGISSF